MINNNNLTEEEVLKLLRQRLPEDKTGEALRNTLKELNQEYFVAGTGRTRGRVISLRKVFAMTVAAAVVILAITLWPRRNYIDEYGKIQMISTSERGSAADSLLQRATVYFNDGNFAGALPILRKVVSYDTTSHMILFYLGITELRTGETANGRGNLEKVYGGESIFRYEAAFYLALSYAEQQEKQAAIEWLRKIPLADPASEKAAKLLKKL